MDITASVIRIKFRYMTVSKGNRLNIFRHKKSEVAKSPSLIYYAL